MKTVKTTEAVGLILCHDMTQIIKDEFKGPRFKKRTHCPGRGYSGSAIDGKRDTLCLGR